MGLQVESSFRKVFTLVTLSRVARDSGRLPPWNAVAPRGSSVPYVIRAALPLREVEGTSAVGPNIDTTNLAFHPNCINTQRPVPNPSALFCPLPDQSASSPSLAPAASLLTSITEESQERHLWENCSAARYGDSYKVRSVSGRQMEASIFSPGLALSHLHHRRAIGSQPRGDQHGFSVSGPLPGSRRKG